MPSQVRRVVSSIEARDEKKAKVLVKYLRDMEAAIARMHRVLEPGRACIIVIGPSTMRSIDVPSHTCLATLAERQGFDLVEITPRKLDRNRRMMPAGFRRNHNSQIESRMHEEYVVGLVKPSRS